jgi:hypothetical protein
MGVQFYVLPPLLYRLAWLIPEVGGSFHFILNAVETYADLLRHIVQLGHVKRLAY